LFDDSDRSGGKKSCVGVLEFVVVGDGVREGDAPIDTVAVGVGVRVPVEDGVADGVIEFVAVFDGLDPADNDGVGEGDDVGVLVEDGLDEGAGCESAATSSATSARE
jgi:hypothetical protein